MRGIAQQHDMAIDPGFDRVAVDQRKLVNSFSVFNQTGYIQPVKIPLFEHRIEVIKAAFPVPVFPVEKLWHVKLCNPVDQLFAIFTNR